MTIHTITQEQLDNTPQRDRRWRWPGVTGPGQYTWNERRNTYEPVRQETDHENPHDFSHSGLGIGGVAHHDMAAEISELIADGKMDIRERPRQGPMPHGQLWEPCPRCGQEPVCLDCGLCEEHCRC